MSAVDDYIEKLDEPARSRVTTVVAWVHRELPEAEAVISYGIPTFRVNGRNVVHVSGYTKHLSLYPAPSGDQALDDALAPHKKGKGTLQFQHRDELPEQLIVQVVHALAARAAARDGST